MHVVGVERKEAVDAGVEFGAQSVLDALAHHRALLARDGEHVGLLVGQDGLAEGDVEVLLGPVVVAACEVGAVVAGRPSERWGSEVVGIVRLKAGHAVSAAELIESLGAHLARYKLPRSVHFMSSLPRTALGKIRRLALAAGSLLCPGVLQAEEVPGPQDGQDALAVGALLHDLDLPGLRIAREPTSGPGPLVEIIASSSTLRLALPPGGPGSRIEGDAD